MIMAEAERDFFNDSKSFMRLLGQQLHQYEHDAGITFQRDMQLFMQGRYAILNKHCQIHEQSVFGIDDAAYQLGAAFAGLAYHLIEAARQAGQPLPEDPLGKITELFNENIVKGYADKMHSITNVV